MLCVALAGFGHGLDDVDLGLLWTAVVIEVAYVCTASM